MHELQAFVNVFVEAPLLDDVVQALADVYAVEELYEVKVDKINLLITPQGVKKAFVKLTPEYKASDVAIKLGIL